jgi:ABC-2 type transport system ATP-binding protein
MPVPAIEVVNLEKVYSRRRGESVRAVDGLTFSIAPGSIFGLLGPNGAGKTTTLKILTTLIKPTAGQARVLGIDAVNEPLKVRQHIAVVIQESAVELFLSVRDNLHTFARFHGLRGDEIERRASRVIAQFGLESESGKKVMDLSGGFRRRVQVAKVFMVDTPVVFLDEFSTGMDPILKRSIMALLRESAQQGRTIVLTTQILQEAEELCDDILIVNRGREVARGDLHTLKLLASGVYEVTITFDRVPEGLEAELAARDPLRLSVSATTVEIALKEPEHQVLELVTALSKRAQVLRVEIGGASLEDVFVQLMLDGDRAAPEHALTDGGGR